MTRLSKINFFDLTPDTLRLELEKLGQKKFRQKQLLQWVYGQGVCDFSLMSNISKNLISLLSSHFCFDLLKIKKEQIAKDQTIKWQVDLGNNESIETVYIPDKKRNTLCISSQVGCILDCKFCATAKIGFKKNLSTAQIVGQIYLAKKRLHLFAKNKEKDITNIVFMGMGEPLLNIKNVINAIKIIQDDLGFCISKRKITVSTSGVVPALRDLYKKIDVALAISLHSPFDEVRSSLMPINEKYPIKDLLDASKEYVQNTFANRGKVTVEYLLIKDITAKTSDAKELAKLLSKTPCKINLIPFNTIAQANYKAPTKSEVLEFANILIQKGYTVTIRKQRGDEISGACGQLACDIENKKRKIQLNLISTKSI